MSVESTPDFQAAVAREVQRVLHPQRPSKQVTNEPVRALAHCTRPECRSLSEQYPVDAIKDTITRSFRDEDASSPFGTKTATSHSYLRFVNLDDGKCPACGAHRDLSEQVRPVYAPLSGKDPQELLKIRAGWTRGDLRPPDAAAVAAGSDIRDVLPSPPAQIGTAEFDAAVQAAVQRALAAHVDPDADPALNPPLTDSHRENGNSSLPTGVRERAGAFQCYWRDPDDGKQRQRGGFASAEEAAAHRERMLADDRQDKAA